MDVEKGIFQIVIAAIPAVIVYFVGWSYLYFYLGSFGINISELKLDLQTIFIYAYSPLRTSISFVFLHWGLSLLILALAIILFMVGRRLLRAKKLRLSTRVHLPNSPIVRMLMLLVALVLVTPLVLAPWASWAATRAAGRIWEGSAQEVVAVVSKQDFVDEQDRGASWLKNYRECQNRRELGLIFSGDEAYYMLCRSKDDPNIGLVFEVRHDGRLASVRFVNKGDL